MFWEELYHQQYDLEHRNSIGPTPVLYIYTVWHRTGGIPVFAIHIASTALPKTHYVTLTIARALGFQNVNLVHKPSPVGLDPV